MNVHDFFYRIGLLVGQSENSPTKRQLLEEIRHNFMQYQYLPNYVELYLKGHYSHRLLKETMKFLGYRIPVRPSCIYLKAWKA